MKIMSLIFCFLFTAAFAHAQEFRLLKFQEFKKLNKEQRIEYVKELSKRMGVKPNKSPSRMPASEKPTFYQLILSEILPKANAEDENLSQDFSLTPYERWQQSQVKRAEKQAEIKQRADKKNAQVKAEEFKKRPVPAFSEDQEKEKQQLESKQIQLQGKQSSLDSKLEGLKARLSETVFKSNANDVEIRKVVGQINELEAEVKTLITQNSANPNAADADKIDLNSGKIEKLQEKLSGLQEKNKQHQEDAKFLQNTIFDLKQASGADTNKAELDSVSKKLAEMNQHLKDRSEALKAHGDLVMKINAEEEKIIKVKKEMENKIAERARLENEKKDLDDEAELNRINTRIGALDKEINGQEKQIKGFSKDATKMMDQRQVLAARTGLDSKGDVKGKISVASGEAGVTTAQTKPAGSAKPMTEKELANATQNCSRPKLSEEEQFKCAQLKDPSITVRVQPTANTSNSGGAATEDKDPDFCPTAGFVVRLEGEAKNHACPTIQNLKEDKHIGKIKGKTAEASCPSSGYGPEQTALCNPIAFGLTKDNKALCVAPRGDRSALCVAEMKNKGSVDKIVEVILENPEAYEAWRAAINDMCITKKTKNETRWSDTEPTCNVLIDNHNEAKESYKNKTTKPAPSATK